MFWLDMNPKQAGIEKDCSDNQGKKLKKTGSCFFPKYLCGTTFPEKMLKGFCCNITESANIMPDSSPINVVQNVICCNSFMKKFELKTS